MSSTHRMRRMRKRDADRIRAQHLAGNHDDCIQGCSPDNPDPNDALTLTFGTNGAECAESLIDVARAYHINADDPRMQLMNLAADIVRPLAMNERPDLWSMANDIIGDAFDLGPDNDGGAGDWLHSMKLRLWRERFNAIKS